MLDVLVNSAAQTLMDSAVEEGRAVGVGVERRLRQEGEGAE